MIISHSHRFIFFSNPKTGSESLRALLDPWNEVRVQPWRQTSRAQPFYPHMPPREALAVFRANGWDWEGYTRLTCVRNPYPRLVSLYRMIAEVDGLWALRRQVGLPVPSFDTWLAATRPDGRGGGGRAHQRWRRFGTWSAGAWTHDAAGRRLVSDTLRLEHLDRELPDMLARLGLPDTLQMPHVNRRPSTPWQEWYSDKSRKLVARRYAWDLANFQYS